MSHRDQLFPGLLIIPLINSVPPRFHVRCQTWQQPQVLKAFQKHKTSGEMLIKAAHFSHWDKVIVHYSTAKISNLQLLFVFARDSWYVATFTLNSDKFSPVMSISGKISLRKETKIMIQDCAVMYHIGKNCVLQRAFFFFSFLWWCLIIPHPACNVMMFYSQKYLIISCLLDALVASTIILIFCLFFSWTPFPVRMLRLSLKKFSSNSPKDKHK